jgi:hypothetical protein
MQFQTPDWVCDIMVNQCTCNPKTILEPTPGEGNLVNALKKQFPDAKITAPNNYFELPFQRFDAVVTNPPFSPMKTGYQMLEGMFYRSDNIIALMPWMSLINSEKRYQLYQKNGLKQVIHLPRKAFPASRVQCCILVFEKGYDGNIRLQFI